MVSKLINTILQKQKGFARLEREIDSGEREID